MSLWTEVTIHCCYIPDRESGPGPGFEKRYKKKFRFGTYSEARCFIQGVKIGLKEPVVRMTKK